MPENPLLILVDMDGTIADFEGSFLATWQTRYPDRFFEGLPPITGAIAALNNLDEMGHQIFICTTPWEDYSNSLEKVSWVDKHFGPKWVKRMIITQDKTLIKGHIFIDDAPNLEGATIPTWNHILFDQPYNHHITDRRRLNWQNYREVLGI